MKFNSTKLDGVVLIELESHEDSRGSVIRTYCEKEFANAGISVRWVQCNHTITRQKGTIRGIHYQADPFPEAKLVRCLRGSVWDVVVDIRPGSPTQGQWEAFRLEEEKMSQLFIPAGFAHGFQCLTDDCHLFYQMSEFFHSDLSRGVRWDDPELAISWPLPCSCLSDRDRSLPHFSELS